MKIHRKRSVETKTFYVVLAVREDKRREVLGVFNKSTESALDWDEMLAELHERGMRKIDLVCADGLKGLEDVISTVFPGTPLQCCTTHLKRNLLGGVRNGDKGELAENLREVYRTGDCSYTAERAREQWQVLCEKWGGVSQFSMTGRRFSLQSILHLSELRGKDSVDDLYDEQLDRATAEGHSTGRTRTECRAQRGVGSAADG
jgi:transposase-like protein